MEEHQSLKAEIADLERAFQQNVARDVDGIYFTIHELDGVPEDELAKWKSDGPPKPDSLKEEEATHKNHHGWKFVPFANGGTRVVLTYAHSPDTRKKIFLEDNRKLSENKTLFEDIAKRRAQKAQSVEI